jgi:hypothetical protein
MMKGRGFDILANRSGVRNAGTANGQSSDGWTSAFEMMVRESPGNF